jgi:hypothetical protein
MVKWMKGEHGSLFRGQLAYLSMLSVKLTIREETVMDSISRTKHCEYVQVGAHHGGGRKPKETKEKEVQDDVVLSTPAKSSKSKSKAKSHRSDGKAKAAKSEEKKAAETPRKGSSVAVFLKAEDYMPDTGASSIRGSGPDDVDDNGACGTGISRTDNADNPDSVYDDGTCGSGSGSDGYNYSGPDGSYSYDEFH